MDGTPVEKKVYVRPVEPVSLNVDESWKQWLHDRGIGDDVIERNRVYTKDGTIRFPYLRDGEWVNEKERSFEKSFRLSPGAELIPYGYDDCANQSCVIVVEGEMDKLAVEQSTGYTWVTSPPNGVPPVGSKPNDEVMSKIVALCEQATRVILAGDMDAPGKQWQELLAERLGYHRVWRVVWPEKDANDTLIHHGESAVRDAIRAAQPYPVSGIVTVDDVMGDLERLYLEGMTGGIRAGWSKFDRFYSVKTKQLTTVTGAPGHGKSTWLDHMLVNLAQSHGWKFGICSPEMVPVDRHVALLCQQYTGKPFGDQMWNTFQRMTLDEMRTGAAWVRQHFQFILPEQNTIQNILDRARIAKERWGINGLVIDPVNTIEESREKGQSTTEYIHWWIGKVRSFMTDYDLHVWLVAHPRKLGERRDSQGRIPVATPYDIADSAGFYNRSDNILSVWRDPKRPQDGNEVHIQKIKFPEIGSEGYVRFDFDRATGRFRERQDA